MLFGFGQLCRVDQILAFLIGQPAIGHDGVGVAFGAIHDRCAMRLVARAALLLAVAVGVWVHNAHPFRLLLQILAREGMARVVHAEFVGILQAARLNELRYGALAQRAVVVSGNPFHALGHLFAKLGNVAIHAGFANLAVHGGEH